MKLAFKAAVTAAVGFAFEAHAASLTPEEIDALLHAQPGTSVAVASMPIAAAEDGPVVLHPIDIYAPGARITIVAADGPREAPRSGWRHYITDRADRAAPRLAVSLAPDGRAARAALVAGDSPTSWSAAAARKRNGLVLLRDPLAKDAAAWSCDNDLADAAGLSCGAADTGADALVGKGAVVLPLLTASVAIDLDNEMMQQRFGNDSFAATLWLETLLAQMNPMYERDLAVHLLVGDLTLRPSSVPDPYLLPNTSTALAQLDEMRAWWNTNRSGVQRSFVAFFTGRGSGSGIAYIIGNGTWCSSSRASAYSLSRLGNGSTTVTAADLLITSHEIGHTFGSPHTHCESPPIDTCNGTESGCYSGTAECPAPATVNGVPAVTGTIMGYCHLRSGGCTSKQVFHPRTIERLLPRVATNFAGGCLTAPAGPGDALFGNGFE